MATLQKHSTIPSGNPQRFQQCSHCFREKKTFLFSLRSPTANHRKLTLDLKFRPRVCGNQATFLHVYFRARARARACVCVCVFRVMYTLHKCVLHICCTASVVSMRNTLAAISPLLLFLPVITEDCTVRYSGCVY